MSCPLVDDIVGEISFVDVNVISIATNVDLSIEHKHR
jgi:hypothetical protein